MIGKLTGLPQVSICIPAYRSQLFIRETIESALAQTVDDVEIIISNDAGFPTPHLDAYRSHPQIRVIDQSKQLGWVRNTNAVMAEARGHYFMVLPHDDTLAPTYLASALRILSDDPDVSAAYSDLATDKGVMVATEVTGSPLERIIYVMRNLYNGYSFRAVMRRDPRLLQRIQLRPNPPTDFCADTTWMLQQACLGTLRKTAAPLYHKRLHANATHTRWEQIPPRKMLAAWRTHCMQMGRIAADVVDEPALIADLVRHRLDPRRVDEAPHYLKAAIASKERSLSWRLARLFDR